MSQKHIVVVGSSNTDMVIRSHHLPGPGETILGGNFFMNPGGKGANQAVAAAKLGADVKFVAKVGDDIFGKESVDGFSNHGIDTRHCLVDSELPSGVALIMVAEDGENCISVALGANGGLTKDDIDSAKESIESAAFVLVQLEIPMDAVEQTIAIAHQARVPVVLNPAPAPAYPLTPGILAGVEIITPNQSEAQILTGVEVTDVSSAEQASLALAELGVGTIIITMGKSGAYVYSDGIGDLVSGVEVKAVDTTAAGDTFNGALVTSLASGRPLLEAVEFANRAAAFSVTKPGAQSSTPTIEDLESFSN